jgi:hypothetical protein
LIAETEQLRSEIQSLKAFQARKEQEFLQTVEEINSTHKAKFDAYIRESHDNITRLSNESADKIERLQRES